MEPRTQERKVFLRINSRIHELVAFESTASTITLAVLRILAALFMLQKVPQKLSIYYVGFSFLQLGTVCLMLSLSIAMLVGFFSKTSTFLLALLTAILYGMQSYGWSSYSIGIVNLSSHTYERDFIYWTYLAFFLSLSPCGAVLSVDSLRKKHALPESSLVQAPSIFAMRTLLVTVYFWTALSKCNSAFLDGFVFETIILKNYTGSFFFDLSPATTAFLKALSLITVILEFALTAGLVFRRSRPYAVVAGLGLHFIFVVVLPVSTFSYVMAMTYLLFINQKTIDHDRARILGLNLADKYSASK